MANTTKPPRFGKSKGSAPSFRNTKDGIVPNSVNDLHSLTLDAATRAALTTARVKLVLEIDAGGTRVFLADSKSSDMIGSPDDLQKLGSVKTFLARQRKDAAGEIAAKEITQTAFLSEKIIQVDNEAFQMAPVDNSYGAALRPYYAALLQLEENEKLLKANVSTEERETYLEQIQRYFSGIGRAYTRVISTLSQGGNVKGKLVDFLFEEGVPAWVASKFASKNFRLERMENLSKVFFPSDPMKGLSLSVREWTDPVFFAKQGTILDNSTLIHTLLNDEGFLRSITKIDASIGLDINSENPMVRTLMGAKAVVMPRARDASKVIELGSKSKSGFKYPTPGMDSVANSITSLSTAVLRIYSANFQSVDLVNDYYAHIVPGSVSIRDVTPTNNFYVQWGKHTNPSGVWLDAIQGGLHNGNTRTCVWRWLRTEMKLSEIASGRTLAMALKLQASGKPTQTSVSPASGDIIAGAAGDPLRITNITELLRAAGGNIPDNTAKGLTRPLTEVEKPLWKDFQKRVFPSPKKEKDPGASQNLTSLSNEGRALVKAFEGHSSPMALRVKTWLRSFSDDRLQKAAVKSANAMFDEIFSDNILESEDDSSDDEESDSGH